MLNLLPTAGPSPPPLPPELRLQSPRVWVSLCRSHVLRLLRRPSLRQINNVAKMHALRVVDTCCKPRLTRAITCHRNPKFPVALSETCRRWRRQVTPDACRRPQRSGLTRTVNVQLQMPDVVVWSPHVKLTISYSSKNETDRIFGD